MNPQDTKDAKKPAPSLPTIDQVPEELRGLKRWCCWKAVWDVQGKRWTKIPHSPITGEQIGAKPRGTKDQRWEFHWTDFAKARAAPKSTSLMGWASCSSRATVTRVWTSITAVIRRPAHFAR